MQFIWMYSSKEQLQNEPSSVNCADTSKLSSDNHPKEQPKIAPMPLLIYAEVPTERFHEAVSYMRVKTEQYNARHEDKLRIIINA